MSPTLSSQPTFIAPLILAMPVPTAQGAGKCLVNGCGQSRIADDCACRVCRKHCIEMGGCASKKHRPSTVPVHPPAPPAPLMPPMTPLGFPHHPSPPRASTPLLTSPPTEPSSSLPEVVDARPDPRFASHLHLIFTETLARQHELQEQKRRLDSERQDHAKKTKERVAVYAWTRDDTPHVVHVVQTGFIWPYFVISSPLLSALGLLEAGE